MLKILYFTRKRRKSFIPLEICQIVQAKKHAKKKEMKIRRYEPKKILGIHCGCFICVLFSDKLVSCDCTSASIVKYLVLLLFYAICYAQSKSNLTECWNIKEIKSYNSLFHIFRIFHLFSSHYWYLFIFSICYSNGFCGQCSIIR